MCIQDTRGRAQLLGIWCHWELLGMWLELQEFGVQGDKAMEGQSVLSDNPKAWSGFFQIWMVPVRFPQPHLCLYPLSQCPLERESEELQLQHQIAPIRPDGDHFVWVFCIVIPLGIHPRLLLGVLPFPCSPLGLLTCCYIREVPQSCPQNSTFHLCHIMSELESELRMNSVWKPFPPNLWLQFQHIWSSSSLLDPTPTSA